MPGLYDLLNPNRLRVNEGLLKDSYLDQINRLGLMAALDANELYKRGGIVSDAFPPSMLVAWQHHALPKAHGVEPNMRIPDLLIKSMKPIDPKTRKPIDPKEPPKTWSM